MSTASCAKLHSIARLLISFATRSYLATHLLFRVCYRVLPYPGVGVYVSRYLNHIQP